MDGKLLFDIGANHGLWTLANIGNNNKIVAVDPSPQVFNALINNTKRFRDRIIVLKYAICNNDNKPVNFYECKSHTLSTLNKEWIDNPKSRFYKHTAYNKIECESKTLDALIYEYGMPDLIKLDVENGEYECIQSLTHKVKLLCFEWASEFNDITIKCLDYLKNELKYEKFYIQIGDEYKFRPNENDYVTYDIVVEQLSKMVPKREFGMLWCCD